MAGIKPYIRRCFRGERYKIENNEAKESIGHVYSQIPDQINEKQVSECSSSGLSFPS